MPAMFKDTLQPGASVPEDGTYWVHHYQHRTPHLVSAHQGDVLPDCVICHERVRYEHAPASGDAPPFQEDRELGHRPEEQRERA